MSDTQQTQPTDTEMLDWMIERGVSIYTGVKPNYYQVEKSDFWASDVYPTPRAAISAEMAKEEVK